MSAHVGIQFHAAPSEPQLMTGTRFLSLGGIVSKKKKLLRVHKRGTHGWQLRTNIKHGVCTHEL